jgi:hypothetical protein
MNTIKQYRSASKTGCAHLDLVARRDGGERIDGRKITKHRNDVFRLYRTLAPADRFELAAQLRENLNRFLEAFPAESPDWQNIEAAVGKLPEPQQVIAQIRTNFGIGETA